MRTRSKTTLGALFAAALLAVAVGSASATHFEVLNTQDGFLVNWAPVEFKTALTTVRCHLTLQGSFHSAPISKVSGTLIGYVTRAMVNTCAGGTAVVLTTHLPWHLQYLSFEGPLPLIRTISVSMIGAEFRITPQGTGVECLAASTQTHPARGIAQVTAEPAGILRQIGALTADRTATIPLTGNMLCPATGFLEGIAEVTYATRSEFVDIQLIR